MMESCKLCFKAVPLSTAILIDETLLEIFETLLITHNVTPGKAAVLCESCNRTVQSAFLFKSKCLETEDSLVPYISNKNVANLSKLMHASEGLEVCRLCKNFVGGDVFVRLTEMLEENKMLEIFMEYIPEINLEAVKDPIICGLCQKHMQFFCDFIESTTHLTNDKGQSEVQIGRQALTWDETKSALCEIENRRLVVELTNIVIIQCEECGYKTTNSIGFEKHLKTHVKVIYKCKKCPYGTKLHKWFQKHMLKVHSEHYDYFHECSECDYKIKHLGIFKRHLLQHKPLHEIPLVNCHLCDYKTKRKDTLEEHVKLVHLKLKEYKCIYCEFQTGTKKILKRHMLCIHNYGAAKSETFKCHLCSYVSKRQDALKVHMIRHQNKTDNKLIKCELCDYRTQYKGGLKSHMMVHMTNDECKIFKCDYCTFKTKRKHALKDHRLIHDQQAQYFECHNCNYKSRYKQAIKSHIKRVHSSIKDRPLFQCNLCSFAAKYKHGLQNHILALHSKEEKRFKCQKCDYRTHFTKSLNEHIKVHMRNTNKEYKSKTYQYVKFEFQTKHEKNELLKCHSCSFQTKYKQNLRVHMDVHKNLEEKIKYKCTKCHFGTKYERSLKIHYFKMHHSKGINQQKAFASVKKETNQE